MRKWPRKCTDRQVWMPMPRSSVCAQIHIACLGVWDVIGMRVLVDFRIHGWIQVREKE